MTAITTHTNETVRVLYEVVMCVPSGERRKYKHKTEHFEKNSVQM